MSRLRVAVVGAGRIGSVHAATVTGHPRAVLACVADPVEESARSLGESLGVPWTTDVEAALTGDADAVLVCSPTALHGPHTQTAVAAGKHVLMEKPIALDLAAADACLAAVGANAARVMIGFNRRFSPEALQIRERLDAGVIGPVEQVTIISRDPAPPSDAYLQGSGGLFKDMTIHDFDMARFLVGDIAAVHATGQRTSDIADAHDGAVVTLTAVSGAVVVIINSRHCAAGYDQRMEIFGRDGSIEQTNQRATSLRVHTGSATEAADAYLPFFLERYARAYATELDTFLGNIARGVPQSPSLADGRAALVLADAAAESIRTGGTVRVEAGTREPNGGGDR
ncbi:MAG: Gfo/Idh/MocA family oxidoreductase [Propionibacteriaceae bacterium]|nr:Gfo/Idh/MocA family oxidoreductase [Propionibacteriaceae bacterium]